MPGLTPLHSLWIGEKLGWLERLCLTSWVTCGHAAVLWTYNDVSGVPATGNASQYWPSAGR